MWFTDAATVGASAVRWSRSSREARVEGAARGEIYNMHDSRERVDTGVHFIKFEVASGSPYLLLRESLLSRVASCVEPRRRHPLRALPACTSPPRPNQPPLRPVVVPPIKAVSECHEECHEEFHVNGPSCSLPL